MDQNDLPLGFAMALGMDQMAMKRFEALPEDKRNELIERTRGVSSKREMQLLVAALAAGGDSLY